MNRFKALLGLFATVLLVGAGCAANAPADDSVVKKDMMEGAIKVGFIAPLTGDAALYGEPGKNIVELAVEKVNESGGVNGRVIEMIYEDGKCSGKDAATAMQKLVNVDKVKYVIGGFCSGESLAAAPLANENKVVLFSPGSSSPELTTKGGPFFIRNYPSDSSQGIVLAEGAVNGKNWKNIGVMQELTDYAQALADTFTSEAENRGATVRVEQFTSDETDFRTALTKFNSQGVEAVFLSVQSPKNAELILRQMQELGWKSGIIGADVFTGSEIPKSFASFLVDNSIMAEFGYNPEGQEFQQMVADYKEKFGKDPDFLTYAQTEYDAVMMLADALKAVGTEDSEAVIQWMLNAEGWSGVSGVVEFTPEGDRKAGHDLKTVDRDGNLVPFSS